MPTAVLLQETSDVGRSIVAAMQNTKYFRITHYADDVGALDRLLASGEVVFAVEIPVGFERALRRGDRPELLVAADATDPVAVASAFGTLRKVISTALANDRAVPDGVEFAFEIREHRRYNPAGTTQLNIVPGLLGTILTLTMLIFTGLSVTREAEQGTMEGLLAMPITPFEIMLGKILPYILVGFTQGILVLSAAVTLFGVPVAGNPILLAALTTLFITTNLSIGYTFSTFARTRTAVGADGDDVLSAEHPAVGFHVSVFRHAGLGAGNQPVPSLDALPADRAVNSAQRIDTFRPSGERQSGSSR